MLKTGILNPQINSLLSRVRHTNTVIIADRGFPFWPTVETAFFKRALCDSEKLQYWPMHNG